MPSLRDRPADLLTFAENYLKLFAGQMKRKVSRFSTEAQRCLLAYPWPGNLRELRNTIERAVILTSGLEILPRDLPTCVQAASTPPTHAGVPAIGSMMTLEALEREHIRRVVEATPTIQEAARVLGIDAATIYRKRRKSDGQEKEG